MPKKELGVEAVLAYENKEKSVKREWTTNHQEHVNKYKQEHRFSDNVKRGTEAIDMELLNMLFAKIKPPEILKFSTEPLTFTEAQHLMILRLAKEVAKKGTGCREEQTGAVMIRDGELLAVGWDQCPGDTCEEDCYVSAATNIFPNLAYRGHSCREATLYLTHEPNLREVQYCINGEIRQIIFGKPHDKAFDPDGLAAVFAEEAGLEVLWINDLLSLPLEEVDFCPYCGFPATDSPGLGIHKSKCIMAPENIPVILTFLRDKIEGGRAPIQRVYDDWARDVGQALSLTFKAQMGHSSWPKAVAEYLVRLSEIGLVNIIEFDRFFTYHGLTPQEFTYEEYVERVAKIRYEEDIALGY